MSNWKSDYKKFQGNWENIGFMTESQAIRLENLSNDIDGYALTLSSDAANLPISAKTGTILFNTTTNCLNVWDGYSWKLPIASSYSDVFGNIDQAAANGSLTLEAYRDTPVLKYWFRSNQDDTIYLSFQMPHYWDLGDVEPHIHVIGTAPTTGNVRIVGRYAWSRINNLSLPIWNDWTTFSVTQQILNTEQWLPKPISLGLITPPANAKGFSAFLHIQLTRPGLSDNLDTYDGSKPDHTASANLMLEGFDVHVKMNAFGTASLYA